MKKILLFFLNLLTKPLAGRGFVAKHMPFLIKRYETMYSQLNENKKDIYPIPLGASLKVNMKDTHVAYFLSQTKKFEPTQTKIYLQVLEELGSSVIFDIGANVGYYSILGGKKNDKNKVFAFEPDTNNYELLYDNVKINGLNNVECYKIALYSYTGLLSFEENPVHTGASQVISNTTHKKADKIKQITCDTLDNFCEKNRIYKIDVIKLDVEGSELPILTGAKEIITKSTNLKLFIEYNPKTLSQMNYTKWDFFDLLNKINLKPTLIIDESREEAIDFTENALKKTLAHTTYCGLFCEGR